MRQFQNERFNFVGKLNPNRFVQPDFSSYDNMPLDDNYAPPTSTAAALRFVRVTKEGYQYIAQLEASDLPSAGGTLPHLGSARRQRNRSLLRSLAVVGTDERVSVNNTQEFPYRAIGQADFGDSGEGGCTVTMIARNAALTAGHCVFDKNSGKYLALNRVGLGRYRSNGATVSPFGVWTVETRTTTQEYLQQGMMNYDIAVITFAPQTRDGCNYTYPGDVVGYLGIDRPVRSGDQLDPRLSTAVIAGYPMEKPRGEMWKSGPCEWKTPSYPQFGFHYCDTKAGNSGSGIIVSGNILLGEHAYGFGTSQNGAILMEGPLFDTIYNWAGLGQKLPTCGGGGGGGVGGGGGTDPPRDCPCDKIVNQFSKVICLIFYFSRCVGEQSAKP